MQNSGIRRIVIKVGTSTLTGGTNGPDRVYINSLAAQIASQRLAGRQVILVSSGAIRAGMGNLDIPVKPRTIPQKQAAASVGQGVLMRLYADIFANYAIPVGQVLLTRDDLRSRQRYINARNTFEALLDYGALPIVNENDTVAIDEIRFGDNDTLAALVTSLVDAQGLILLSDVEGLYDSNPSENPDARLVETVEKVDASVVAMAGGAGTPGGTGGMRTKLSAARIATGAGATMWIANGRRPNVVYDCLIGTPGMGTRFAPSPVRPSARKRWIAFAGEPRGTVVVNAPARHALEAEGRSLLPVGIVGVNGDFEAGDLIAIADESGDAFARGFTRYSSTDVARMAGHPTPEIGVALGLPAGTRPRHPDVVHRDQMVLQTA